MHLYSSHNCRRVIALCFVLTLISILIDLSFNLAGNFGSLQNLASVPASPSFQYRSTMSLLESSPLLGEHGNMGLRAIAISPEGHHLAVGDRSGQIK